MIGWREVVISYPCDTCGAGPGDRCRTVTDHEKWEPHAARSLLASNHYWLFPEIEEPEP
jgi:hypothetical protein